MSCEQYCWYFLSFFSFLYFCIFSFSDPTLTTTVDFCHNPFKPSDAKWLHFKAFGAMPVLPAIFNFFWHSGTLAPLSARVPECQKKLKMAGKTGMAVNALVDSFLAQSEKYGNGRVMKIWDWLRRIFYNVMLSLMSK